MVGSNRVTEQRKNSRARDVTHRRRLQGHSLEVGGLSDIGGLGIPLKGVTGRGGKRLPAFVTVKHRLVLTGEHLRVDRRINGRLHLGSVWPYVCQEHVLSARVLTQGLRVEVEVHGSRECIGNHERGACQVVHLDVGIDASFKVSVSRENSGHGQVVIVHRLGNLLVQGARVSDTGGAAIADQIETEGL